MPSVSQALAGSKAEKSFEKIRHMYGCFWVGFVLLFCNGAAAVTDARSVIPGGKIPDHNANHAVPGVVHKLKTNIVFDNLGHLVWSTRQGASVWLTGIAAIIMLGLTIALHLVNNALTDMSGHTTSIYIMMITIKRTPGNNRWLLRQKRTIGVWFVLLTFLLVFLGTITGGPIFAAFIFMAMYQCGMILGRLLVSNLGQTFLEEDTIGLGELSTDSEELSTISRGLTICLDQENVDVVEPSTTLLRSRVGHQDRN